MNDIYAVMLSWAVTLTGYPMPEVQPEVRLVSHQELVERACGGVECKVLGWFPPGQVIYLDERLDPQDSLYASSVLVHEMVHYLQQTSGRYPREHDCETAIEREREAYAIQREFLTRYDVYQPVGAGMHLVGCGILPDGRRIINLPGPN